MKAEWRFGDVHYVSAPIAFTGSQYMFAALIEGLVETANVALVRFVKATSKGGIVPDLLLGILYPKFSKDGHAYAAWIEVRLILFYFCFFDSFLAGFFFLAISADLFALDTLRFGC